MTIALSYKPKCGVSPKTYHYPAAAHHYPPSHKHHYGSHSHAHCYPPKHCPSPCYDGHHYDYSYAHPVYHGTYVKAPACKPTPCDKPSKRKCVRHHYHTHEYGYGPSVYYPSFWFGGHGHHHGHGYHDSHHHGHYGHHGYHTAHHGHSQSYGHGWPYYEY